MNGVPLKLVEKIKYLGIYLNNKLSWHNHIEYLPYIANCSWWKTFMLFTVPLTIAKLLQ